MRELSAFFASVLLLVGAAIQTGLSLVESVRAERALRASASSTRTDVSGHFRRDRWVARSWATITIGSILGVGATWPF